MTTPYSDDEYNDDDQTESQPNWRRKLEADAKAGREAAARAEAAESQAKAAQRELAMMRAGINIESPVGAMFSKAYDGEVDVDLIKSEWAKIQPGAEGTPQVGVPADQQAALNRINDAASGGAPSGQGVDFGSELDSIPLTKDGSYNPDYVNQVLAATAAQAAREGRQFAAEAGQDMRFVRGAGPATAEL